MKNGEKNHLIKPFIYGLRELAGLDSYLDKMNSFMRFFEIEGDFEKNDETKKKFIELRSVFEEGNYFGLFKENGKKYISISVDTETKPDDIYVSVRDFASTEKKIILLQNRFMEKFNELFPSLKIRLIHKSELLDMLKPDFETIDSFLD